MIKIVLYTISLAIVANPKTINGQNLKKCPYRSLEMCLCTKTINGSKYDVVCSNAKLTRVPGWIPPHTTHLYLDNNLLRILKNDSFPKMRKYLKFISLKHNRLVKLESELFNNVPNLQEVNLYNNRLNRKNSLPGSVFEPLRNSLTVLDIRRNFNTTTFYHGSIGKLNSLIVLGIDYVSNDILPIKYENLKDLKTLIFQGKLYGATYMKNETFDSISRSKISEISLEGLNLGRIEQDTFSKLKYLKKVDLSNNPELGFRLPEIALSLRQTSLEVLNLDNVGLVNSALTVENILMKFCGLRLEELTLEGNYLHVENLNPIFSKCFPTLKILSLSINYILGDINLIKDILKLKHLVGFNISHQMALSSIPKYRDNHLWKRQTHICQSGMACPFMLPPTLRWVDASYNGAQAAYLPELVLMNNSSLQNIYVSNSGLQTITYPVFCPTHPWNIVPNVELIDLSSNDLQCINASFFDKKVSGCDWASLEQLYLGNNKLGNIAENICYHNRESILGFLEPLTNLKKLDLSNNKIRFSSKLTSLQKLKRLEDVDLSSNQFNNFSLNLEHMDKLSKINLSNNNLKCLSVSTTNQIDKIKNEEVSLDLSGNPLSCNCECYNFFKWMGSTTTKFVNNLTYRCEFYDGEQVYIHRLSEVLSKLESHCFETHWFKIYVSILGFVYFLILMLCIMYRFRHSLWYIYIKVRLNRQFIRNILENDKYSLDAFISCDHRDAKYFVKRRMQPILEGKEGLKLCIAQRDFIVGVTILDNILRAMNRSRKIVFVVSQYFLESGWCKEELKIAQQLSLDRGKNIIICVFMPSIKQEELPPAIRMITKTVTCMKWCPDPKVQDVFFLKLLKGLVDSDRENGGVV